MKYLIMTLLVLFVGCGGSSGSNQTTSDNNTDSGSETTGATTSIESQGSMDNMVFGVSTYE